MSASMGWRRAKFKDQSIWARVDQTGALEVEDGRVEVRYKKGAGAKIYRGGATRVTIELDAPIEELPEGVSPDDGDAKQAAKSSQKPMSFGKAGTRTPQQTALAKTAARELIEGLQGKTILCFTDGACKKNPGLAGAGTVIEMPTGETHERYRSLGMATNNLAELHAIKLALELLEELAISPEAEVSLFTDSNYVYGVLTKNWNAKANADLISTIRSMLSTRPKLAIHWIAGHVGIAGNERADALANQGCYENK